ncbi:MAG: Gfo/Idh/MocA family oxidoreductase [Acidobacteriota bacterium]|nr:Gfo/Idh/MocA family oxidoreductase [Acidobacteriota bacterium]
MVGTGYMARKHCDVLASREDARLRVVCSTERSSGVAAQFKEQYGFAHATTDYDAALSDAAVKLVFVCSPDGTHADYVVRALGAGKHVFCEKPLGRTAEEFRRVREGLDASGRVLQVGMNCRFREQYSIPKRMVEDGELGGLRFLRGTYIYNAVSSVRGRQKPWALEYPPGLYPFMHGGGIHCLDLLRWVGGEVKSVFARATGFELADDWGADTFLVSLEFEGGAMGELLASASAFRPNDFSLELWLGGGSIIGTNIFRRDGDGLASERGEIIVRQEVIDLGLQYADFVRAIESGGPPLNSFAEAYENFRVLRAVELSAREGKPVDPRGLTNL